MIGLDGDSMTIDTMIDDEFTIYCNSTNARCDYFAYRQVGDKVNVAINYQTPVIVGAVARIMQEKSVFQLCKC